MRRCIAIVGSREGIDRAAVNAFVDHLGPETVVISGGAAGADTYAAERAAERGLRVVVIRPNWKKYGRSAGFRRNKEIVMMSDDVVAFWDGASRGTENTLKHAIRMRRPVAVFSGAGTLLCYIEPGAVISELRKVPRTRKSAIKGVSSAPSGRHQSARTLRRVAARAR